jgi:hypothetical protein
MLGSVYKHSGLSYNLINPSRRLTRSIYRRWHRSVMVASGDGHLRFGPSLRRWTSLRSSEVSILMNLDHNITHMSITYRWRCPKTIDLQLVGEDECKQYLLNSDQRKWERMCPSVVSPLSLTSARGRPCVMGGAQRRSFILVRRTSRVAEQRPARAIKCVVELALVADPVEMRSAPSLALTLSLLAFREPQAIVTAAGSLVHSRPIWGPK